MGKRMKVLGKRRGMIIVTAAVLLLAVGAWVGSGANFSKTEAATADNTFSAGFVELSSGGLTANIGPLAPGGEQSGTATVANDGNVEGHFYLTVSLINETPGTDTNSPPAIGRVLSEVLRVYVTAFDGTTVSGPYSLAALDAGAEIDCGVLPYGDTGTVTVRAVFPDGNATDGLRGADNGLMNAVSTVRLNWTVVSTGS